MTQFRMLIGDDIYAKDPEMAETDVFLMLGGIRSITKKDFTEGRLNENGIYVCERFPLVQFNTAKIKIAPSIEAMMEESRRNQYDWIVSDLSYGHTGYLKTGGITIINAIRDVKAIKTIFTETDNAELFEQLKEVDSLDYIVAPHFEGSKECKPKVLGFRIGKHYNK
jgi:hypothetical protein